MATVRTIETSSLGDRSYLAHDGEVAFVVDPQRDVDRVLRLAEEEGVRITHVLETHIHNDYVTGGLVLAERTGAAYHVNADDEVSFERVGVRDGDVIEVSPSLRVRVVHTPGHTFTHLSYVLEATAEGDAVAFTGGSLLFGTTGRPDLLGQAHAEELARHQHASAHRLVDEVPDSAAVMPTHGFGSFCSATQSDADESTIGRERTANPALTQDVETYVRETLDGLDLYPAYYAHMGPANASGPPEADLTVPVRADKVELARRIDAGEWVVDLRTRRAFAAGHVPGTYNVGLDGQMSTWVGWVVPWGAPVTLLGESEDEVAEAVRELARIGYDNTAASATGGPREWTDGDLATLQRADFGDLLQVRHHRPVVVLDVRNPKEHAQEHLDGAVSIPLGQLVDRVADVPDGEVWVHCASGYRASVAASILAARGRQVVVIDDDFDKAGQAGLVIVGS